MRKKLLLLSTLFSIITLAQNKQEDIKAIKSMCGCYEVQFNFTETFQPKKDSLYIASPTKKDWGLEWVELVEDTPNKIVMQHLLIVSDSMIIKHWRQDWLYENTDLFTFDKDLHWKYSKLDSKTVKGQWTQKVYQVDDSPRYEGSATWIHADGKHYWMNTTDAPLPRREHTIRNDYNVLKRRNIHEITAYGWLHEQDNVKIKRDDKGNDTEIAQEKGLDLYKKVDDSKCKAAQNWWKTNQLVWKNVRTKWQTVFDGKKDIYLEGKVDKKPLYSHLFSLKTNATKKESDAIIDSFIKK